MEKNTVIIDLDRYEDLMTELAGYKEELQKLRNVTKDNILISKEDFYIDECSDGVGELYIKLKALEHMIVKIGGYKVANTDLLKEVRISSYYFKLEKED